jgi:arginyl-tRNA synthetase
MKLISWPYILQEAASTMQPHKLTNYLEDLCSNFHVFWNKGKDNSSLRILDENNMKSTISRIIWIRSFRNILKEVFTIIDISFPENM